jgi:hypothetical protein
MMIYTLKTKDDQTKAEFHPDRMVHVQQVIPGHWRPMKTVNGKQLRCYEIDAPMQMQPFPGITLLFNKGDKIVES